MISNSAMNSIRAAKATPVMMEAVSSEESSGVLIAGGLAVAAGMDVMEGEMKTGFIIWSDGVAGMTVDRELVVIKFALVAIGLIGSAMVVACIFCIC